MKAVDVFRPSTIFTKELTLRELIRCSYAMGIGA